MSGSNFESHLQFIDPHSGQTKPAGTSSNITLLICKIIFQQSELFNSDDPPPDTKFSPKSGACKYGKFTLQILQENFQDIFKIQKSGGGHLSSMTLIHSP